MKYLHILILMLLSTGIFSQPYFHIEPFPRKGTEAAISIQYSHIQLLSNHRFMLSDYNSGKVYLFDGKMLREQLKTGFLEIDKGGMTELLPEKNGKLIGTFALVKGKDRGLYISTYTVKKGKWSRPKKIEVPLGEFPIYDSENNQIYYYAHRSEQGQDSLFFYEQQSNRGVMYLAGRRLRVHQISTGNVLYSKADDRKIYYRKVDGKTDTYPALPEGINCESAWWLNGTLWAITKQRFYIYKEGSGWKEVFRAYNQVIHLTIDEAKGHVRFILNTEGKIGQAAVFCISKSGNVIRKYPFRSTEQPVGFTQIFETETGFWWATATKIIHLSKYIEVFSPELDAYPGNVWTTATASTGETVFAAYQHKAPLAIYKEGEPLRLDDGYVDFFLKNKIGEGIPKPFVSARPYKNGVLIPFEYPYGVLEYYPSNKGAMRFHKVGVLFMLLQSEKTGRWHGGGTGQIIRTKSETWSDGVDTIVSDSKLGNILGLCEDNYGRLWWIGNSGLYMVEELEDIIKNTKVDSIAGPTICSDKWGGIWMGDLINNKVRYVKLNSKSLPKAKDFKSYKGEMIVSIATIQDSFLVLGGTKTLGILHLPSFYKTGKFEPRLLKLNDGLPVNMVEQNCFNIDTNGKLWVAFTDGTVIRFAVEEVWKAAMGGMKPPSVEFLRAKIGNKREVRGGGKLKINSDEKGNIAFEVIKSDEGLHYGTAYQFQLYCGEELLEDTTLYSSSYSFQDFSSGKYLLEVRAVLPNGAKGETIVWEFEVMPRLESMLLVFLLPMTLLGVSALVIFAYFQEKQIKKIERENQQFFTNIFNGQMNLHLLGNGLELVATIAQERDVRKILNVLGKNIRLVFDASKNNVTYHSLEKELTLIGNNLFLFKKLYGDRLVSYEIPDEDDIEHLLDVNVPLQCILTHIDNAVEHGINSLDEVGTGKVTVRITEDEDYLIIEVIDNGIGRKKAAELGLKGNGKAEYYQEELMNRLNCLKTNEGLPPMKRTHEPLYADGTGNKTTIYITKNYNYV